MTDTKTHPWDKPWADSPSLGELEGLEVYGPISVVHLQLFPQNHLEIPSLLQNSVSEFLQWLVFNLKITRLFFCLNTIKSQERRCNWSIQYEWFKQSLDLCLSSEACTRVRNVQGLLSLQRQRDSRSYFANISLYDIVSYLWCYSTVLLHISFHTVLISFAAKYSALQLLLSIVFVCSLMKYLFWGACQSSGAKL